MFFSRTRGKGCRCRRRFQSAARTLGPGTRGLGASELLPVETRLGVYMLVPQAPRANKVPGPTRDGLRASRREKGVVRLEEDRPSPEVVQEAARGTMMKESYHRGRLAVGKAHLGCLPVALLEGREAIREVQEGDPEAHLEDQGNLLMPWAAVVAKIE